MKRDISGFIFKKARVIRLYTLSKFCTCINYTACFFRKIKIGKNCLFYGQVLFFRHPESRIEIGSKCTFRSDKISNLIGVNKRTIVATHKKNAYISIADNSGFSGTVIGAFERIIIGENVRCGANTVITDGDWHLNDVRSGKPAPVIIEDNVWLGLNSIVLKGVTIGRNSVIGANSVVVKNIPPNVIAAGNPCVVIKNIPMNLELANENDT